jgi:hypothetical protein
MKKIIILIAIAHIALAVINDPDPGGFGYECIDRNSIAVSVGASYGVYLQYQCPTNNVYTAVLSFNPFINEGALTTTYSSPVIYNRFIIYGLTNVTHIGVSNPNAIIYSPEIYADGLQVNTYCTDFTSCNSSLSTNFTQFPFTYEFYGNYYWFLCKRAGIPSDSCMSACGSLNPSLQLSCGGDITTNSTIQAAYCDALSSLGGTCVSNSYCQCSIVRYNTPQYAQNVDPNTGQLSSPIYMFDERSAPYYIYEDMNFVNGLELDYTTRSLSTLNMADIYVTLDGRILTVLTPQNITGSVIVVKGNYIALLNYSGTTQEYLLPSDPFYTSGTLTVDLYSLGVLIYTQDISITGQQICMVTDCLICPEVFSNWSCLGSTTQAALIIILICLSVLALATLPIIAYIAWLSIYVTSIIFRWIYQFGRGFIRSRFLNDARRRALALREYVSTNEGQGLYTAVIMTACLFCVVDAQCSTSSFIPSTVGTCTVSGFNKTCVLTFDVTFDIPGIGQSTCLTLLDIADNQTVLGSGTIKFLANQATVTSNLLYYTYPWLGDYAEVFRCGGLGNCQVCNMTMEPTGNGEIQDSVILNNPGVTYCHATKSGFGTNCITADDGCVFVRYVFEPYGLYNFGMVNQPNYYSTNIFLAMDLSDAAGNVIYNSAFTISSTLGHSVIPGIDILYNGEFSSPQTLFTDQFVYDIVSGVTYYVAASNPNGPVAGEIGEIQTPYPAAVAANSNSASLWAPTGMVVIGENEQGGIMDLITFSTPSYNKLTEYNKFPMNIGPNTWGAYATFAGSQYSYDLGVRSNLTDAGAVSLTLETTFPVTFVQTISRVCPQLTLGNVLGCYNCPQGFSVVMSAYSTCSAGPALVQNVLPAGATNLSTTVYTNSVNLNTAPANILILGASPVANPTLCIELIANGGNATACVSLNLTYWTSINNGTSQQNSTYPGYYENGDSTSASHFFEWLFQCIATFFERIGDGKASWWEYLIFAIILITIAAILYYVSPYILALVNRARCCRKRNTKQYSRSLDEPTVITRGQLNPYLRRR